MMVLNLGQIRAHGSMLVGICAIIVTGIDT